MAPSLAGPKRPQDRVLLTDSAASFKAALATDFGKAGHETARMPVKVDEGEAAFDLGHGDVVIAAITSCTNTSNPSVLIAAGLVARKARAKGLKVKPWVKTSLAPGSKVVTDYLQNAGLQEDLDALGFNLVGYGCTTCIGNSGPLPQNVSDVINADDLVAVSVLSGNRNFEGRVNPDVRANYLASPPLGGRLCAGGLHADGPDERAPGPRIPRAAPVYLRDVWPTNEEVAKIQREAVTGALFANRYADVFQGDSHWQGIPVAGGQTYVWDQASTYVQNPPYFTDMTMTPKPVTDIQEARILAIFGDSITTDHISPAGSIRPTSPAGRYLLEHEVPKEDFNSYGARRGNHEVMMRGTFANIRIQQPDHAGDRGRRDQALPVRERDGDLRRGDAVPDRGAAPRALRGQGIRHRLVPRLGGQGHAASRCARGDRRKL